MDFYFMTDASGRETAAFHTPAEADLQACTRGDELREQRGNNAGTTRGQRGDKLSGTDFRERTFGNGLSGTTRGQAFGDGLRGGASGRGFREQTFGSATQGSALPNLFRPQKRDFAEFRNIFTFAMK